MNVTDRRFLLLGDWHWLVRDPLDVLRVLFFTGTVAFAVIGRDTAVGLTAASVLLLVARIVNLPRRLDLGVIVAMTLIAWGTALSLYGQFDFYDTVVHGTTPAFYAPVLYVCLVRLGVLTDPGNTTSALQHAGVFISTLAIGMAVGAGYEVIEWGSDSLLGTKLVESADDTGRDLLADTLGSLVGATLLTVWSLSGWSSVRSTYRQAAPPRTPHWARRALARIRRGGNRVERARATVTSLTLIVCGIAAFVFGVLVFAWPQLTVGTLVLLFGIYAVGYGLLKLVIGLIQARRAIGGSLVLDALGTIGAGMAVLVWPRITAGILFYFIAFSMILGGLAGVAVASVLRLNVRDRSLLGAVAIGSVVLGVVVLAWPSNTVSTLRWLIGAQALLLGSAFIVTAFRVGARPSSAPAES
jgi:uncharacterized membrane protein HdeD (DUF308 family)/uncharacterized membrane protein YjdF